MTNKQRRFFALSGTACFTFFGSLVFFVGHIAHLASSISSLGILMLVGGLLAAVFLCVSLPR